MKHQARRLCSWFEDDDGDEKSKVLKSTTLLSAHDIISYNEVEGISEYNDNSHLVNDEGMAGGVSLNAKDEGDSLDIFMMGIEASAALDTQRARDVQQENSRDNIGVGNNGLDSEDETGDNDRSDSCDAYEATSSWGMLEDNSIEKEIEKKRNGLRYHDTSHSSSNRDNQIRPLEKFDNSSITFESFRRSFLRQNYTSPLKNYCDEDIQVTFIANTIMKANQDVYNENTFLPLPIDTFEDLSTRQIDDQQLKQHTPFPPALFLALQKAGYKIPTPIQRYAMPLLLSGCDLLCTASTGSGKTLAYALPLVVHVCDQRPIIPGQDGPIGLIIRYVSNTSIVREGNRKLNSH
jgi:hypothetical protein